MTPDTLEEKDQTLAVRTREVRNDGPAVRDWAARWEQLGRTSFLKQSQSHSPEKWQDFYDRVSNVWGKMAGMSQAGAREIAGLLARHDFVRPEDAVLEVGCGPGHLSMALAEKGCRVTAMDSSRGMIRVLKENLDAHPVPGVRPLAQDWCRLDPVQDHDRVLAAFFPEAFSPEGIRRMEQLARQTCVLVLGTGVPAFPFHRRIWTRLMDAPYPVPGAHLACAVNFLKQTGRSPRVIPLRLPAVLDMASRRARDYFRDYFAMLGSSGPSADSIIDQVLAPHTHRDRINLEGWSEAALVCWPVSFSDSGSDSKAGCRSSCKSGCETSGQAAKQDANESLSGGGPGQ